MGAGSSATAKVTINVGGDCRVSLHEKVAPTSLAARNSGDVVRIVSVPDLGRCLVAARAIEPGEVVISELPILSSAVGESLLKDDEEDAAPFKKLGASSPASRRLIAILRAYCAAPASVRNAVREAVSTIEYDASQQGTTEQVAAVRKAFPWAAEHSTESLTEALMAFNLNAHGFGDNASAIFPTIRLMQHACDPNVLFAPRPSDQKLGRGVAIATRAISAGEPLCISYHDCTMGRRMRRKVLARKKQFVCRCAQCRAPDWNAQVPCPGCHPRTPGGHLPADDPLLFSLEAHRGAAPSVHYARRDADAAAAPEIAASVAADNTHKAAGGGGGVGSGVLWRCAHCSRTWSAAQVFPSSVAAAEEEAEEAEEAEEVTVEEDLELLVLSLEQQFGNALEAGGATAEVFQAALSATRATLGMRHWATVKLLSMQSLWLCTQLSLDAPERAAGAPDQATCVHTLLENEEWLWRFCAASGTQPCFFAATARATREALADLESDGVEEAALRPLMMRLVAMVVAGDIHGLPAQQEAGQGAIALAESYEVQLMRSLDAPPTCEGAAEVLCSAGDAELKARAAGSALLFYRRAHLYAPHSDEIPVRIADAVNAVAAGWA